MIAEDTPPPTPRAASQPIAPELAPTALGRQPVDPGRADTAPPPFQQSPPLQQSPPMPMRPSAPLPDGYPVVVGGRPFSSDLAPSNMPPRTSRPSFGADASQAAAVLSPVGDQYRGQVDWAAAAARPAKAIPPWMLAALFAGALFIALIITIVIAKIIR